MKSVKMSNVHRLFSHDLNKNNPVVAASVSDATGNQQSQQQKGIMSKRKEECVGVASVHHEKPKLKLQHVDVFT